MTNESDTTRNCVYRARNVHDALREFLRLKHLLRSSQPGSAAQGEILARVSQLEKLLCRAVARNMRVLALDVSAATFPLGTLVQTGGSREIINFNDVERALGKHMRRDWGDCGEDDIAANRRSLAEGGRILSVHQTSVGVKFWIVTEADRSATTVLLPCEY